MKKLRKSITETPIVGQRVEITGNPSWAGIHKVIEVYEDGMISIDHPYRGVGAFYPKEFTVLPLTKLEKALK